MDTPAAVKPLRFNRILPYWAVFQADVRQTLRSWIYRLWVVLSIGAAVGYLLYRFGARQTGILQPAPDMMSDLLRWYMLGCVTLIIVLTGGTVCGERGTMADSVLSRGISRYQYFLGKWHSRLITVLITFFVMGIAALISSFFLLNREDLSINGSFIALVTVGSFLVVVTTCGVAISAVANSSVVSIAVLWIVLYGGGFVLSMLPDTFPSPERAMQMLPHMFRGHYDLDTVYRLVWGSLAASCVVAAGGMFYFSRRDV